MLRKYILHESRIDTSHNGITHALKKTNNEICMFILLTPNLTWNLQAASFKAETHQRIYFNDVINDEWSIDINYLNVTIFIASKAEPRLFRYANRIVI